MSLQALYSKEFFTGLWCVLRGDGVFISQLGAVPDPSTVLSRAEKGLDPAGPLGGCSCLAAEKGLDPAGPLGGCSCLAAEKGLDPAGPLGGCSCLAAEKGLDTAGALGGCSCLAAEKGLDTAGALGGCCHGPWPLFCSLLSQRPTDRDPCVCR